MTTLRKKLMPSCSRFAGAFFLFASVGAAVPMQAQQAEGTTQSSAAGDWHSNETVHLIGFPEVKQKAKGQLSISPTALTFASPEGNASVPRSAMLNVSIGDVRIESGGTAGKITRAIIPFGGGAVVATVTHKRFSLLTVEFDDQRGALHGAIFLLPKDEALQAQQQLGAPTLQSTQPAHAACEANGGSLPDTIKVEAITSSGEPIPAEYRMLIYEQLVRRLHEEGSFTAVYRDGDDEPAAACPKFSLLLTLKGFKKGDAAVRASTGPVGFFVGATKLKLELQLQGVSGNTVFHKELQASQRGDTDSLNIADKIAKALTKEARKGSIQPARS